MQTRKKSISLHALGVIPAVPRGSAAHRSASSSSSADHPTSGAHPSKRLKRSHTVSSDISSAGASPSSPPPRRRNGSATTLDRQRPLPHLHTTPPPSPSDHRYGKLDTSGIGDDIVVGVLHQLEATGNRPHQIKELATALAGTIRSVDSSSNPVAIISSRLTNYLRRPWTALAPCPLAKEQVNIHPRRVYYFLTTCPRQQIPDYVDGAKSPARIITPSISSGPEEEDGVDEELARGHKRDARSLSPELDDFELADLGLDSMAGVTFEGSAPAQYGHGHTYVDSRRAVSPPLEHDEREFTQTATSMANRAQQSASQSMESLVKDESSPAPLDASTKASSPDEMIEDVQVGSEEFMDEEAAKTLFGHGGTRMGLGAPNGVAFGSSPMLRPVTSANPKDAQFKSPAVRRFDDLTVNTSIGGDFGAWSDLKSPEAVGLSELDDMLGGF